MSLRTCSRLLAPMRIARRQNPSSEKGTGLVMRTNVIVISNGGLARLMVVDILAIGEIIFFPILFANINYQD